MPVIATARAHPKLSHSKPRCYRAIRLIHHHYRITNSNLRGVLGDSAALRHTVALSSRSPFISYYQFRIARALNSDLVSCLALIYRRSVFCVRVKIFLMKITLDQSMESSQKRVVFLSLWSLSKKDKDVWRWITLYYYVAFIHFIVAGVTCIYRLQIGIIDCPIENNRDNVDNSDNAIFFNKVAICREAKLLIWRFISWIYSIN